MNQTFKLLMFVGFIANDNNFDMGDIPPLNSFLLTKFDTNPPHRSANQNIQPPDFLMVGFFKLLYINKGCTIF